MFYVKNIADEKTEVFQRIFDNKTSGGELLEIRLLDNQLVNTFGRKSTARHKIYQLLESS
jgi:hypothetical protein